MQSLRWHVVEWSELSSRMLAAMRPDLDVYQGPFERWVREHGPDVAGRVGLILANPPYGARGVSITEDPDRSYREKNAYAYFLRRGLDLLAPNGLGVFLVPSGFLTGRSSALVALREKVLKRHHLSAAYRLPSAIFPGALLVTDLLFSRARDGELAEVDESDRYILDGRYFEQHPEHILGTEVGRDAGEDDQTKKPRWGYQVTGTFQRLPDLVERPVCGSCALHERTVTKRSPTKPKASLARQVEASTAGLSEHAASAVALGLRVDRYLAAASAQTTDEHVQLWPELIQALTAWTAKHGNPWASADLRKLVADGHTGAERFLQAFTKAGKLIEGLATKPTWTPRYAGKSDDPVALAEWVYRIRRSLTLDELAEAMVAQFGHAPEHARSTVLRGLPQLLDAGWCLDGDGWDHLVPERDHLTGHLWPKHARAKLLAERGQPERVVQRGKVWGVVPLDRIAGQAKQLMEVIAPAVLDDIGGVSPRQGWVPLELVADWLTEGLNRHYGRVHLERREGLVQVRGLDYDRIDDSHELSAETRWCIGWINHDKTTFKPKKRKDENLDEVRLAKAREWDQAFRAWVGADPDRTARVAALAPAGFRRTSPPTAPHPSSHIEWRRTGDAWHAWAGRFDLYTGIVRRRTGILNDPDLSDEPIQQAMA